MKKNYGLFTGFMAIVIGVIAFCVFYVFSNVGAEEYTFNKDGYALYVKENNNYKAESYAFTNGSSYSYKKSNNKVVFESTKNGNVSIDASTVVHYADDSLLVLKNVVGLDLTSIDNELILYYNIYKNTNINFDNGGYTITSLTGEKIKFNNMLIRITDNKYLFVADSVRIATEGEEVVDFGKYVYIEYSDGDVVGVYNNTKSYQSIGNNISIVSGEISMNLGDKTISKKGEKYITMSNLVLDSNSNIDLIPQEETKLPNINKPSVDTNISAGEGNDVENNGSVGKPDNNVNEEVVEEDDKKLKLPVFKVTNMAVTPIKLDAEIEIIDEDSLIVSPTEVTVVNNSTLEVVYESTIPAGDTTSFISTTNLDPDTEYTIYAKAGYSINEVEYNRSFLNKIFRTEAIGVTHKKSYATADSLVIDVVREGYSDVTGVDIVLYFPDGSSEYQTVDFQELNNVEVVFNELSNNTEYRVVMTKVMCGGVQVEEGYSEEKIMSTLKNAPVVNTLTFEANKRTSTFQLNIGDVSDPDYGIISYRYEVFRVDQNMNTDVPLITIESDNIKPITLNVDEYKLNRGSAYTYRVVIIFNDNEKIVEYVKELGQTMQLDGVTYPTVRFEETYVTWEQINGTIIVDDSSDTIVGDNFRIVYKNSVDVFTTKTITASSSEDTIPISVNGLRANETYTFQVYADVNLKDGNPTIDEAYIGSVIVQTGKPNSLEAKFSSNLDYGNVFSVNVKLSDYQGVDSKLEASTMTSLLVTLYQGATVGGSEEAKMTVVDEYDEEYVSSIKTDFYDSQFTITPAFFNLSNSDFEEKSYTITLSKLLDYTTHKNEIPIVHGSYSFGTNSYVPDVPTDEHSMVVSPILNKNFDYYGLDYDNNLEPNTVVGYHLAANYPNDALNALNMIYHVWIYNPAIGDYEMIPSLDRVVPYDSDGNVEPAFYPVGYGTNNETLDVDMLRRGNKYFFSYEVELDLNGDGVKEDLNYPAITGSDVILRSAAVVASKQQPVYKMYPSISTDTSATWKYQIKDIDGAFAQQKLYAFSGNNLAASSTPEIILNSEEFESITFTNLKTDTFYSIRSKLLTVKGEEVGEYPLSTQFLSSIKNSLDLTYTASVDSNTLSVGIDNYYDKIDIANCISSADITISAPGVTPIVVRDVKLVDGVAYVNLIKYPQLVNLTLTIGLTVYFDSGNTGFDVPSETKALQVLNLEGTGNYYSISSTNELELSSDIYSSNFTGSFDPLTNLINITNKKGVSLVTEVEVDERGVYYKGNPISFKELKSKTLSSDSNQVSFSLLVPSISLVNDITNKLDITQLLTSAIFNVKLTIVEGIQIQNNLIYLELYKTDDKGLNPQYIKDYSYTPEALSSPITLSNLSPQENYAAKFYAYVYDEDQTIYRKLYLYDEDSKTIGASYKFHTLSNVGIDNVMAQFVIDSYESKIIKFSYTLENIIGYKEIRYELYELVDSTYQLIEGLELTPATLFNYDMSFEVDAGPGNEYGFAYGKSYKLKIIPIGIYKIEGEDTEVDLGSKEYEFTLNDYVEPQVSITGSKDDESVFFRVNIKDASGVISGGTYSVTLKEAGTEGKVIATQTGIELSSYTRKFTYDEIEYDLERGKTYMLVVTFLADYKNTRKDLTTVNKSRSVNYGNTVSIGEVSATKTPGNNYGIDIIFADSYLLNQINRVVYTVSSTTIDYFSAGENAFTTTVNQDTGIHTHTIYVDQNANFKSGNVYTVSLRFYTGETLIDTADVSYYYAAETGGGE